MPRVPSLRSATHLLAVLPLRFQLPALLAFLAFLALFICAMPAQAQPATRELRSPKGLLTLDSRVFLFGDDGTAGTLAWIEDGRDMLPFEDGVLVAGTNLALYGYTLLADETPPESGSTPPLWKADIRNAALATDGISPLVLGVPPESALGAGKTSTLLVMRRAADGSWTTEATNISVTSAASGPSDVSVARVVWAGDRWLATLSREAPPEIVEKIRTSIQSSISRTTGVSADELTRVPNRFFRAEIWQSPDGRTWTHTELPTRAQHCRNESFTDDLEVVGANQVFLASVYGRLYRAGASLEWLEIATPLGEGIPVDDLSYADGRFLAHGRGWIATSADARSWSTWTRSWDFSVSANGPHVANGSFRWFSNEDPPRNLTLDEAVANKTPLQQAPPDAQEVRDLSVARLIAPDPSGTVAVVGEHLCRRNPDGTMQSGMFVGRATSLAAGVDGIAVASDMLHFVTSDKLDAAKASLPLIHACTASDSSGVAEIAWSCTLASEADLPEHLAPYRAWETNAAPGTSQTERALRTLLGVHDGGKSAADALQNTLAGLRARATQISQANEPIRVGIWRELALAAGIAAEDPALGAKRGRDLFTALAGLPDIPYDEESPWMWADTARKALMSISGNSIRGTAIGDGVNLRDELLKLLAAMEWYGVDLPPNRARAAMSLFLCADRRTQSISAGFMLVQLTEPERESFDTFIGFLDDIPYE